MTARAATSCRPALSVGAPRDRPDHARAARQAARSRRCAPRGRLARAHPPTANAAPLPDAARRQRRAPPRPFDDGLPSRSPRSGYPRACLTPCLTRSTARSVIFARLRATAFSMPLEYAFARSSSAAVRFWSAAARTRARQASSTKGSGSTRPVFPDFRCANVSMRQPCPPSGKGSIGSNSEARIRSRGPAERCASDRRGLGPSTVRAAPGGSARVARSTARPR